MLRSITWRREGKPGGSPSVAAVRSDDYPSKGSSLAERSSTRELGLRPYGQRQQRCGKTFVRN
jgi:hypothetical protein